MNYLEWSQEYLDTAAQLAAVMERLREQRRHVAPAQRKELDDKLALYRGYHRECTQTAAILRERHRDAA